MVDFHPGKGLHMHPRPFLVNGLQHLQIPGKGQIRVHAAHHMDLVDRLVQPLPHLPPDLVDRHLIGQRVFPFTAKSAELAQIDADIRVVDVLVVDKVHPFAVQPLAHDIGQIAQRQNIRMLVKGFAVCKAQPFAGAHLFQNVAESGLLDIKVHVIPADRKGQPQNKRAVRKYNSPFWERGCRQVSQRTDQSRKKRSFSRRLE